MNITVSTTLSTVTCPACGGLYAISESYLGEAQRRGGFKQCWTCPYCKTSRGYGEGEADKLRKQIADLESSVKWTEERKRYAEQEAEHFRRSRDGMRGALAKERKRVGNGVCPRCNRTFSNLGRHMATKHPEHKDAVPEETT